MNRANVEKIVILTGMLGRKVAAGAGQDGEALPRPLHRLAQYDWSKIDDANFSAEMVAQLDDAVRRGARGLKVLKDLGLGVKDRTGN